ncbi:cytochrome P450 2J1 [Parasteatoda tepidariorum]|uniref:cytochrome P450 2J1 n=1 Tax=Parasteatoda tepidariorum TaxID=114398 RepID=UPI001C71EE94|nr:cytochrome P450 2J1 [Parasteatoda tepidariorum]XP_015906746.2 cytochrome P450 2J1 [Parasteatoda tepidariorum]
MSQITTEFYIAIAVVLLSLLYYHFKSRGTPPGPYGFPYLGLWPILRHDTCHLQLMEYGKKYGDVFSFTYTGRLFIHFGNVKAVREAHITKTDCFYERPDSFQLLYSFLNGGVVYMRGEGWKTARKFLLNQFRERGMTTVKDHLSGPIYDIVRSTIVDLRRTNGQPVDIAEILLSKCTKVMRQTLFGNDGVTEQELVEFNRAYFKNLMCMTSINLLLIGNFAKYFLFPFHMNVKEGKKGHVVMRSILTKVINRHKATYNENHIRNAIDAFYKEKKLREGRQDPTAKYFTDEVLLRSLLQICADGILFVAMFAGIFIEAALKYPEEQENVYREILEVVGSDRNPEMEDKSRLIYTNAFLSEVMRTSDIFTVFASLECSKETTIGGYRIPKGAVTVYNFWAAHMNPNDYDEPEKFKPSRFLAKDGQKRPDLLPLFGIGKRACMGEGFAMLQVFLFVTTILKNFRLTNPAEKAKDTSLFFYFDKIEVCAHPRN